MGKVKLNTLRRHLRALLPEYLVKCDESASRAGYEVRVIFQASPLSIYRCWISYHDFLSTDVAKLAVRTARRIRVEIQLELLKQDWYS